MNSANETIMSMLNHRTIRKFKNDELPEELVQTLLDVANMSPTSTGMQTCSIIRVTDLEIKKELATVGGQAYLKDSPVFFVFVADLFRNYMIAKEQGKESNALVDADRFLQAFTDAVIAAQSVAVAAESLGLGTNYFGCIHNDPKKIIDLLKLPKYTFPATALGIGYKDQEPMQKPRMDKSMKYFENEYNVFDNYLKEIADFDKVIQDYYDLREHGKRSDKFSEQVVTKFNKTRENRANVFKIIKQQEIII